MSARRSWRRLAAALAVGGAAAASSLWAAADPPRAGYAPDPPAHASLKQWVFDVRYEGGAAHLERARASTASAPFATARVVGRFAIELYIGRELLDRVRFDVPLAGAGPSEKPPRRTSARPSFENVSARLRVQMADDPRATYVQIVDRGTGDAARFWWPPEADGSLVPFGANGGASGAIDGGGDASAPDGGAADAAPPPDGGGLPDAGDAGATPLGDAG